MHHSRSPTGSAANPSRRKREPITRRAKPAGTGLEAVANDAGLRYVSDAEPGIRRVRNAKGFSYVNAGGKRIKSPAVLKRVHAIVIPPAWTDVWICNDPDGHIQAIGRDARGRKQYRYHAQWRTVRDSTKYHRMILFGAALPALRRRTAHDLALPGLPREKVLATVVRLLEKTGIRVGNEEYARDNHSFGLTTLHNKHVDVHGSTLRFEFRGKSGIAHSVDITNRRLARIVKQCQDLPGHELFQYLDANGQRCTIESRHVNEYLRAISGQDFTAKDFRTWIGSVLACRSLFGFPPYGSSTEAKRLVVQAVTEVATQLRNTKAVCRKCYIHPALIAAFLAGEFAQKRKARRASDGLSLDETVLLAFLTKTATAPNHRYE